jgi:hypothetical protein
MYLKFREKKNIKLGLGAISIAKAVRNRTHIITYFFNSWMLLLLETCYHNGLGGEKQKVVRLVIRWNNNPVLHPASSFGHAVPFPETAYGLRLHPATPTTARLERWRMPQNERGSEASRRGKVFTRMQRLGAVTYSGWRKVVALFDTGIGQSGGRGQSPSPTMETPASKQRATTSTSSVPIASQS